MLMSQNFVLDALIYACAGFAAVIPLLYVTMVTVGIPEAVVASGIALILGMDRILDMCRSVISVIGDSVTAVIVTQLERGRGA